MIKTISAQAALALHIFHSPSDRFLSRSIVMLPIRLHHPRHRLVLAVLRLDPMFGPACLIGPENDGQRRLALCDQCDCDVGRAC